MSMVDSFERAMLALLSPSGRRGRLVILTFHRVVEDPDPLLIGEPDRQRFERLLRWLGSLCRVLPLDEAVDALERGKLPSRAAAITFDDGYLNNLEVAKPALVAAGLPATVFVAAEPVRSGIMWNDLIIEGVRRGNGTHDLTDLGLGRFEVNDGNRWAYIERIINSLKYRELAERQELAMEVHRRLAETPPARFMLTEDQIVELEGDGISIGAHTINHPILTRLADADAREEISASRRWLAELTGRAPALFAYPNGRRGDDYDERHVRMVQEAGFTAAVSTRWAAAHQTSSMFELPRFTPWETSSLGFGLRIVKTCAASYR